MSERKLKIGTNWFTLGWTSSHHLPPAGCSRRRRADVLQPAVPSFCCSTALLLVPSSRCCLTVEENVEAAHDVALAEQPAELRS